MTRSRLALGGYKPRPDVKGYGKRVCGDLKSPLQPGAGASVPPTVWPPFLPGADSVHTPGANEESGVPGKARRRVPFSRPL